LFVFNLSLFTSYTVAIGGFANQGIRQWVVVSSLVILCRHAISGTGFILGTRLRRPFYNSHATLLDPFATNNNTLKSLMETRTHHINGYVVLTLVRFYQYSPDRFQITG